MYFNCVFDINSIANSIRKVHSVKKNRLRRATAAQRPSIVRKSLYIDVLGKILDLRGAQGGPVFRTPIATLIISSGIAEQSVAIAQQSVTIALSHRKY